MTCWEADSAGKLTVVVGATGIGKTQLGLQFAHRGNQQEGEPGIIFDMTARGDAQNHADYADRLFIWPASRRLPVGEHPPARFLGARNSAYDSMHIFNRAGRRVTISDLEFDDWKAWKVDLAKKINEAIAFFYGNFIHGVRRCVIDGVEPTDKPSDSFQFHMFEYVYHRSCGRSRLGRARYVPSPVPQNAEIVEQHMYPYEDVGCLLLYVPRDDDR